MAGPDAPPRPTALTQQRSERSVAPPRRRFVTVLFSDLSRSTELAAGMEAEEFGSLMARLRKVFVAGIAAHSGTVAQIRGDGVLAIFGYPRTAEDDACNAMRCALAMHREASTIVWRSARVSHVFRLHTGIHAGISLVDDHDAGRGAIELHGSVANVAARLSDAAGEDEILISDETRGHQEQRFEFGPIRSFSLQGLPLPVRACRVMRPVDWRRPARSTKRPGTVPFIGREHILADLDRRWREPRGDASTCIALVGAAGYGKTRLAEEFLHRAEAAGCQVQRGYCDSRQNAEPLAPMLQMLRDIFRIGPGTERAAAVAAVDAELVRLGVATPAVRDVLLRMLALHEPESTERGTARFDIERAIEAIITIIDGLSKTARLIVFIDDFHWADAATRRALAMIRRACRHPAFVLLATRAIAAVDAELDQIAIVGVEPLTIAESESTIRLLLPQIDPFIANEIRRHAGGNPLFIEELCHATGQRDFRRWAGRGFDRAAWLHALIQSRVEELPPSLARNARIAAVIGNDIPVWLLERLTGCGEHDASIAALATHDFIFPAQPGTLRFKHGVVRDVIYDGIDLRQRKAIHLRIAWLVRRRGNVLASGEPVEMLAYHFGAGGHFARSALYSEQAGDKALATSALDRAKAHYCAALDALDRSALDGAALQRWTSIAGRLATASVYDPSHDILDYLERALAFGDVTGDPVHSAQAHYWLGYVYYALGDSRRAIEPLEKARALASSSSRPAMKVGVEAVLGQAHAAACNYALATTLLDSAIGYKRTGGRAGSLAASLAYSLACKGAVLGDHGAFEDAYACFDEAMKEMRGSNHEVEASVGAWRSAVLLWQGRWAEALAVAEETRAVATRVKSLYVYSMGSSHSAFARWRLGEGPEALQAMADATGWLQARQRQLFISLNHGWLAEGCVESGRLEMGRRSAACAFDRARVQDRLGLSAAYRALALAAQSGGHEARAARYGGLALTAAESRGAPHDVASAHYCAARLAVTRGDRGAALAALDRAQAGFAALRMNWHFGEAARLRAQSTR